jgi:hypothetical protein
MTEDMVSDSVIKTNVVSSIYYCTEDEWRNFTTFTNQYDFPSSIITEAIKDATEQIKKDGFYMIRQEQVVKDSDSKYFLAKRYLANKYKRDDNINIINKSITKYDLDFYYVDNFSVGATISPFNYGRVNYNFISIPYDDIIELDSFNCYFKLADGYSDKQIFVTYWISGKPLSEISYELKRACFEMTTMLVLEKLKTLRLKDGTTNYTLGKQSISRDENVFDEMIKRHKVEYFKWINWFKPFIGKRVAIGRIETRDNRGLRYI